MNVLEIQKNNFRLKILSHLKEWAGKKLEKLRRIFSRVCENGDDEHRENRTPLDVDGEHDKPEGCLRLILTFISY